MFSDASLPEPNFITEIENPPCLTQITFADHIFFNEMFTKERRIRSYIYQMLLEARAFLPENYYFKVYEAYRSISAQQQLWSKVVTEQKRLHPDWDTASEEFIACCDVFCANPYRQGSGHQSGAAIDVTLCDRNGKNYDMGGEIRSFDETADFDYPVSAEQRRNRGVLKENLTRAGFVNYPAEWWHYSFGDRLWAKLTNSPIAIFGRLNL